MVGILKKLTLLLVSLLALYIGLAVVLSVIPAKSSPDSCNYGDTIYISSNGVHLDLILPAELVKQDLLQQLNPPEWTAYLAFGWGDKEFYIKTPLWEDLKLTVAFRALFTNSESAMHVVWIRSTYQHWQPVFLCDKQVRLLNQYIDDSFKKGNGGRIQEIEAAGYSDRDKFYQANGSFSGIQTCNNWVNGALKHAGVPTSIWSPFDKGVLYQVRRIRE